MSTDRHGYAEYMNSPSRYARETIVRPKGDKKSKLSQLSKPSVSVLLHDDSFRAEPTIECIFHFVGDGGSDFASDFLLYICNNCNIV